MPLIKWYVGVVTIQSPQATSARFRGPDANHIALPQKKPILAMRAEDSMICPTSINSKDSSNYA